MTRRLLTLTLTCALAAPAALNAQDVTVQVETREVVGPMAPIWAWLGYDEPNYTYMLYGGELLSEFAEASPVPVYVRAHNLLTSGDGEPALKWGSSNAYTEDEDGNPVYDWTIVDRIFDTYVERGMKPLVEIGFMPEALTTHDGPYRHHWQPGDPYNDIYTGWAYPPVDYEKWEELVYQWVRHSVERYGAEEVETWWWQVWNEPNIGYWQGSLEEYLRLYDHATAGLKRALPTARMGGPHVTAPDWEVAEEWLRAFIEHCLHGTNYATGEVGTAMEFIAFHAKGAPRVTDEGYVRMGVENQLRAIRAGFEIVSDYPELEGIPIVIGESDPEGCAACPTTHYPQYGYRNGTMYSSYTAEQLARTYQLMDRYGVNLIGSVTWAFQFEDQPYFQGFRSLATNGIDKPVMNTFRMLGRVSGNRVAVTSSGSRPLDEILEDGVRGEPDVSAMASRDERSAAVLVWNYHDDDVEVAPAGVELTLEGLPDGTVTVTHYRVDPDHGNAYDLWLAQGSPQPPTPAQRQQLEDASRLAILGSPGPMTVEDGRLALDFELPRQGVSLIHVAW